MVAADIARICAIALPASTIRQRATTPLGGPVVPGAISSRSGRARTGKLMYNEADPLERREPPSGSSRKPRGRHAAKIHPMRHKTTQQIRESLEMKRKSTPPPSARGMYAARREFLTSLTVLGTATSQLRSTQSWQPAAQRAGTCTSGHAIRRGWLILEGDC